ncbi:MAG: hypothetical protein ACI3ZD_15020 [Prevotella sp.]
MAKNLCKLNSYKLQGSNMVVYDYLSTRCPSFVDVRIEETESSKSKSGVSQESLSFVRNANETKTDVINRVFGLDLSSDKWEKKLDHRILTLHSSALLAILVFCKVSKENPLEIKEIEGVKFTKFDFEVPLNCIRGGKSKIDVVLKDDSESNTLFLECKFSEYLHCGKVKISSAYDDVYSKYGIQETLTKIGLKYNNGVIGQEEKTSVYCQGIKQMVSHFIAINNKCYKGNVFLGTMLFDFGEAGRDKLRSYSELYNELAEEINKKHNNVVLLDKALTFQNNLSIDKLPKKVVDYYGFAKNN